MITRAQALTASRFHENHEPAGKIYEHRRNGSTQTWKTRPDEFRVPVKYGLRGYGAITELNADQFHVAEECPTRHVRVNAADGSEWFGIVVSLSNANTIARVQVTTRGTSKHRVGSQVDVSTKTLTYL